MRGLAAGDVVVVAASSSALRDAAHKRMIEMLDAGESLPFDPVGAVLFYVGPTPERPGNVIGSAGPTTASRMDTYTPRLLGLSIKGIIGKGGRGPAVREELAKHTAVYMAALGGGGALAALTIRSQHVVAFDELGTESITAIEMDTSPCGSSTMPRAATSTPRQRLPGARTELLPEELRGT